MITRIQGNNNNLNFGAHFKPIELGDKAKRFLDKASDFSSIHQRIAIGGSALILQPLIDMGNKDVDKDTRRVSAARSAAKAIIGTITGLAVRAGCIWGAELKYAQRDAAGKVIKEAGKIKIDPQKVQKNFKQGFDALKLNDEALRDAVKLVPSVVGTIAALGVMVFTNFLIDAPVTNKIMEKINKYLESREKGSNNQSVQESAGEKNA